MKISDIFKPKIAFAHCDVPCGIYEADTLKTATETVEAMVTKLLALELPGNEKEAKLNFKNTVVRMVQTKEEHAQIAKEQLLMLWTDHFKPEHIEKWPDLHDKIWKAAKLCSEAKRSVDSETAKKLRETVDEIATIFAESKE